MLMKYPTQVAARSAHVLITAGPQRGVTRVVPVQGRCFRRNLATYNDQLTFGADTPRVPAQAHFFEGAADSPVAALPDDVPRTARL